MPYAIRGSWTYTTTANATAARNAMAATIAAAVGVTGTVGGTGTLVTLTATAADTVLPAALDTLLTNLQTGWNRTPRNGYISTTRTAG